MPLSFVNPGETIFIVRVGGDEEVHRHLEELGLVPDTEVTVINRIAGNIVINVRDTRLALDRELASKITVRESGIQCLCRNERVYN